MATLEEILASRDARVAEERRLGDTYPQCCVVVLTVVIPGSEKRTRESLTIGHAATEALDATFSESVRYRRTRDLQTGYEAFYVVDLPAAEAKRRAVAVEETHPLGRLMDIDVIGAAGRPLGRTIVGSSPRRCLVCDRDARYCMRAHTHTTGEILDRIKEMTDGYLRRH